jgi:23S rRNA pseudouridine2605 synthase
MAHNPAPRRSYKKPAGRGAARPGKPGPPTFRKRPPRRPPAAPSDDDLAAAPREGERLQKVLAAAGLASRRECEELITEGRVEVDGQVVSELGARVDRARQEIRIDGEPLPKPKLVYYAIHKPTGVVTTARDPAGRPRVIDLLPPSAGRVFTVGRLDLASEGLILATNDGELANRLTHPKHGVEKTYEVQVAGHVEPEVLAQLRRGVHLSEGFAHAVNARIKSKLKKSTLLEMVLDEGRNREVRRLLARVGHKVQRLTRVAVGPIRLGDMPRGAHRRLSPEEVRKLRDAATAGPKPDDGDEPRRTPRRPSAKREYPPKPYGAGRRDQARKQVRRGKSAANGIAPPRRKIVGGVSAGASGEGTTAGKSAAGKRPVGAGRPAGGARPGGPGRPGGGKAKVRKATGTKVVGRKPVKRRRPERPQRGGK